MAGHNKTTSKRRKLLPTVELPSDFCRTLDSLAARDASTPATTFHRMVVSTLSSRDALNRFVDFIDANRESSAAETRDHRVLDIEPKTKHLFLYLCCVAGLSRKPSEAAGDLVTYYASAA